MGLADITLLAHVNIILEDMKENMDWILKIH